MHTACVGNCTKQHSGSEERLSFLAARPLQGGKHCQEPAPTHNDRSNTSRPCIRRLIGVRNISINAIAPCTCQGYISSTQLCSSLNPKPRHVSDSITPHDQRCDRYNVNIRQISTPQGLKAFIPSFAYTPFCRLPRHSYRPTEVTRPERDFILRRRYFYCAIGTKSPS